MLDRFHPRREPADRDHVGVGRLRWLVVLAAVVPLAGLLTVIALARALGDSGPTYRGSAPPVEMHLPDFALRDESGRPLTRGELDGKAVAITFLDTQCTEACPVIAAYVGRALERLDAEERSRVAVVAITTDPRGDTAASVREFLRRFGVEGELRYLVGPRAELVRIWDAFDVLAETGDSNIHSAPLRVYDTSGRWVSTLHAGADLSPQSLAHDLLAAQG